MNCPFCQKPLNVTETVNERPFVCPHCLSNIENPRLASASQAPNVLRDIRQERQPFHYGLWTWIARCVVGLIFLTIVVYLFAGQQANGFDIAVLGMIGMALLVGLAVVPPFWGRVTRGEQLLDLPRIVGLLAVIAAIVMAVGVFFFSICSTNWR